jgi:phage baseplate assembly protein W
LRNRKTYKINTLDINKNRGIGIKVPFDPVRIFQITYNTKDQVKANLLNFLMTNKGERVFNPNFGADLRSLIFKQMSNLEEIRESLIDEISLYFPNITVTDLIFTPDYNTNSLNIKLSYRLNTEEDTLSMKIT